VAVEEFEGNDPGYRRWRDHHESTGYVMTSPARGKAKLALLHRADCEHLGDGRTGNRKGCSENPAELVAWAKAQGKEIAAPCNACRAQA
jgi:hypothetical protein